MSDSRIHSIVSGRVQGVNFRYYTRQRANQLRLTGWVRNLPDGLCVEVVAEGENDHLQRLIRFLHEGPPSARVEEVETSWETASGAFQTFTVRFR